MDIITSFRKPTSIEVQEAKSRARRKERLSLVLLVFILAGVLFMTGAR